MQGANQNEEEDPIRSLGHNALVELLNNNNTDRGSETGEDIRKGEKGPQATHSIEGDTSRRKKKSSKGKKRAYGRGERKKQRELPTSKTTKHSSDRDPKEEDTKMLKHPLPTLHTSAKTHRERNRSYLRMMNKYNVFFGNGKKPHFIMPQSDHMIVRKNIPVGGFNRRSSSTIKRDIYAEATDEVDENCHRHGEKNDKFFFLKKSNVPGEIMDGVVAPMLTGFSPESKMERDGDSTPHSGGGNGHSAEGGKKTSLSAHRSSSPGEPPTENPSEKLSEKLSENPSAKRSDASGDTQGEMKVENSRAVMSYDVKGNSSTGITHLGENSQINDSHKEVGKAKLSKKRRSKKDSDTETKKLHKAWCDIETTDSIGKEDTLTSLHSSSVKNESNKKSVVIIHPDDRIGEVEKVNPVRTSAMVGNKDFQSDLAKAVKIEKKDSPDVQTVLRNNEGDKESPDLHNRPPTDSISQVDPFNYEDFVFLDFEPIEEDYVEIKKTLQRYRKRQELRENQGEEVQDSNGEDNLEKESVKEKLKDKKEKQSFHQNDENVHIKKNFNHLKERIRRGKIQIISYDFVRNLCYILVRGNSSS